MKHWPWNRSATNSKKSPYWLHLKEQWGFLKQKYWDLPEAKQKNNPVYMRRIEKSFVPASYRSGMTFIVALLLVALLTLTSLGARSLAQQKRVELALKVSQTLKLLDDQLLGAVVEAPQLLDWSLSESFEGKQADNLSATVFENGSGKKLALSESHQGLVELNLAVSEGYRQLRDLRDTWSDKKFSLLGRLEAMSQLSGNITAAWVKSLEKALLDTPLPNSKPSKGPLMAQLRRLGVLQKQVQGLSESLPLLKRLLGAQEPQRILILIQDGAEQRGTGGALSTGIEMLMDNGSVVSTNILSLGEIDQRLRVNIPPPKGLDKVRSRWGLETANVFLNTRISAEKIQWFWQQGARSSLDAIFFVDVRAFKRLLGTDMKSTLLQNGFELQGEDVRLLWSQLRRSGEMDRLLSLTRALSQSIATNTLDLQWVLSRLDVFGDLISEKLLLAYSSNDELQRWFDDIGVSGTLPSLGAGQDVLMVSQMNIGNNATDRWIDETRKLHTAIGADGSIKHWLQITRKHRGNEPREAELADALGDRLSRKEISELARQTNTSMTKILVPLGSTLISSTGVNMLDISQAKAGEYSVWSFESRVAAGNTEQVELVYQLPWKFDVETVDNYQLQIVKQAGSKAVSFDHVFKTPLATQIFQQIPDVLPAFLNKDLSIAIVAGKSP